MKITKSQLKQIIKEEIEGVLNERTQFYDANTMDMYFPEIFKMFGNQIRQGKIEFAMKSGGAGGSQFMNRVGGERGQFKPTGEVSNDTGRLPKNLEQIKADLGMA